MPQPIITEKRDLRTGQPVWLDLPSIKVACRGSMSGPRFDTVIVGAGISGAMLAYRLRGKGEKVLVVDRRPPLHGSTAASTALLQFEIDTPLCAARRKSPAASCTGFACAEPELRIAPVRSMPKRSVSSEAFM